MANPESRPKRETASDRPEPPASGERSSASFLVRCWLEPREEEGAAPILRGYVKNLKTGEETFIKDLDTVGDEILRYLGPDEIPSDLTASRGGSLRQKAASS